MANRTDVKFIQFRIGAERRLWMFKKEMTLGELMRVVIKQIKHDYPGFRKDADENFFFLDVWNEGFLSMYLDPEKKVKDLAGNIIVVRGKGF